VASLRPNWKLLLVALAAIAALVLAAHLRMQRERMQARLLSLPPDQAAADPRLVRFAISQARPLYGKHCARCHGEDLKGNPALGAPNLTDSTWLYGEGTVYDIERTVMYGVRSGLSKTHSLTDMPAYGLTGRLDDAQIRSVVQFVFQLSGVPYDAAAAHEGRAVFYGPANCGDCHGPDGRGDSAYGAPDLTRNVWNSGGSAQALYRTVYSGQHRLMPAWFGTLSLEEIRALSVYIYSASHGPSAPHAPAGS